MELKRVSEQQSDLVKALSNSEQEARNALRDSERIKEMLQMDKTFLQQEQRSLESRLNEQQREREHSVSKALALEVKLGQLTDQLLSLQLNARNGFDERMDKEITRLK